MNNKLLDVQETIYRQIKRLDDDNLMADCGKDEIFRANALTNASSSFIKTINLQLAIINTAKKLDEKPEKINVKLGICEEK
jgi:hypothetical protein